MDRNFGSVIDYTNQQCIFEFTKDNALLIFSTITIVLCKCLSKGGCLQGWNSVFAAGGCGMITLNIVIYIGGGGGGGGGGRRSL